MYVTAISIAENDYIDNRNSQRAQSSEEQTANA